MENFDNWKVQTYVFKLEFEVFLRETYEQALNKLWVLVEEQYGKVLLLDNCIVFHMAQKEDKDTLTNLFLESVYSSFSKSCRVAISDRQTVSYIEMKI